jgi:hypothetical protein
VHDPDELAIKGGFANEALDVAAMGEEFGVALLAQDKAVGATAEVSAPAFDETAGFVEDAGGVWAGSFLVNGMGDDDAAVAGDDDAMGIREWRARCGDACNYPRNGSCPHGQWCM